MSRRARVLFWLIVILCLSPLVPKIIEQPGAALGFALHLAVCALGMFFAVANEAFRPLLGRRAPRWAHERWNAIALGVGGGVSALSLIHLLFR